MEIRAIFIFNNENLVYKQAYPLIEKEVKKQFGPNYEPLPEPNHLQDPIKKVNIKSLSFPQQLNL